MAQNYKAYMFLRGLGYSEAACRRAILGLVDITLKDLAKKVGINHTSNLHDILTGKRKTKHIQRKIAKEFGVPVNELFKE